METDDLHYNVMTGETTVYDQRCGRLWSPSAVCLFVYCVYWCTVSVGVLRLLVYCLLVYCVY